MRHLQTYRFVDAVARAGSIRGAAESLAITPSALNRRILALEDDLGVAVFERLTHGVRLSAAGEILIHHIRSQLSDMERVRSQLADLEGARRGHVSIACSEGVVARFLPVVVGRYREEYPGVTFTTHLRDRGAIGDALADHSADLAVVFEPLARADAVRMLAVPQTIHAVVSEDHPLAGSSLVRLRECLAHPIAVATERHGVRALLEMAAVRAGLPFVPVMESDSFEFLSASIRDSALVGFQLPLALFPVDGPADCSLPGLWACPIDQRDIAAGSLQVLQLRGRRLSVAAGRFADRLTRSLDAHYE